MNINTPPSKEKITNPDGIGTWQWIKWFDNTYKFIRGLMDFFDWNTTLDNPVYREGRMFWDATEHTLTVWTDVTGINQHLGRETIIRVVNKTGSTLAQNSVVYLSGAQGNRPTVALAKADVEATSAGTLGFIVSDILNNAEGYVITDGLLSGFNTSSFTAGDLLYLSDATAGAVVNTVPSSPSHGVRLGYALNSTNNGSVQVKIDNGYESNELHDVSNTKPTITGQILVWDNTAGYYKPTTTAYGEMYATNISQTVTIALANTAYEITAGMTGGTVLRVAFGGNHYLKVTDAGNYVCAFSLTLDTAIAADEVEGGFMINGTAQTNGTAHTTVSVANEGSTISATAILTLAANDEVSLFIRNHTAGRNIIVEHASLTINKLLA